MAKGDCFQVALDAAAADHDLLIVHGLPLGTGPANLGLRYWHAWNEWRDPARGWLVIDKSNDRVAVLPRVEYYRAGHLAQHQVWRFTPAQALAAIARYGHAGPWHPREAELDETEQERG